MRGLGWEMGGVERAMSAFRSSIRKAYHLQDLITNRRISTPDFSSLSSPDPDVFEFTTLHPFIAGRRSRKGGPEQPSVFLCVTLLLSFVGKPTGRHRQRDDPKEVPFLASITVRSSGDPPTSG
jgi:hypothetical protein